MAISCFLSTGGRHLPFLCGACEVCATPQDQSPCLRKSACCCYVESTQLKTNVSPAYHSTSCFIVEMHDVPDAAGIPAFYIFRGVVEEPRKFQTILGVVRAAGPLEAVRGLVAFPACVTPTFRQTARTAGLHNRVDYRGAGNGRNKSRFPVS